MSAAWQVTKSATWQLITSVLSISIVTPGPAPMRLPLTCLQVLSLIRVDRPLENKPGSAAGAAVMPATAVHSPGPHWRPCIRSRAGAQPRVRPSPRDALVPCAVLLSVPCSPLSFPGSSPCCSCPHCKQCRPSVFIDHKHGEVLITSMGMRRRRKRSECRRNSTKSAPIWY